MSGTGKSRPSGAAAGRFPLGAAVTLADLAANPHPVLARLRRSEPVSWLPALGGWLVTSREMAVAVLRDSKAFTVDDPRFTTARVVGPSMLSLDGAAHARHRAPFNREFGRAEVEASLASAVAAEAARLVAGLRPDGSADLRRRLAGPLAVTVMRQVLGLGDVAPAELLAWYEAIVAAVSALTGSEGPAGTAGDGRAAAAAPPAGGSGSAVLAAGAEAFALLSGRLRESLGSGAPSPLSRMAHDGGALNAPEVISNAAVVMFGGIETTEGMISNALLHLLGHPDQLRLVTADLDLIPAAVEESLRLEPAAALVDRYACRDVRIAGALIRQGDLVSVSLAGAGRDPAVFEDPDRYDVRRRNSRLNLAFAHGPHFCVGAHLARLEAVCAVRAVLTMLPGARLDSKRPLRPRGLVFRKPPALRVRWDLG